MFAKSQMQTTSYFSFCFSIKKTDVSKVHGGHLYGQKIYLHFQMGIFSINFFYKNAILTAKVLDFKSTF